MQCADEYSILSCTVLLKALYQYQGDLRYRRFSYVTIVSNPDVVALLRGERAGSRTVKECVCGSFITKGPPVRTGGVLTKERAWVRQLAKVVFSREMCVLSVQVVISRGGEVEVCMTRISMRTKRSLHYI